jgi:hypothetical protein
MTLHRFSREEVVLGGRRGGAAFRERSRRDREEREREIVRIVRRDGLPETVRTYREFVHVSKEHGWPVVSYRRFSGYVAELEERGLLEKTVIVGHGGSLSVLYVPGGK